MSEVMFPSDIEILEQETNHRTFLKNYDPILVSDCCGTDVNLINSPMKDVESVWCDGCHKACNAISEG